jgi:major membrane immunogen (membrane-anchored lipoprotein)
VDLFLLFLPPAILLSLFYYRKVVLILIIILISISLSFSDKPDLNLENSIYGIIIEEPDKRQDKNIYILEIKKGFNVKVYSEIESNFNYGDKISVGFEIFSNKKHK